MRFKKEKLDDLENPGSAKIVREEYDQTFKIISNRQGVTLDGTLYLSCQEDLEILAKEISGAWKDHKQLMPRLALNSAGH